VTAEELKAVVLAVLKRVAPEIDEASVRPDVSLREQLDLDSMDFLHVMLALHKRLGVDIPEADYPKLMTIEGTVAYLASKKAVDSGAEG
jgi:acyl carrier protein